MNQEQLVLYRRIFLEQFKPLFIDTNTWWSYIFKKLDDGNLWNVELEMLKAFFRPVYVKDEIENTEVVTSACMIPPVSYFWDMFFAMFLLFGNERYKYTRDIANPIIEMIDKVKVNPDSYIQFDMNIFDNYVRKVAFEGRGNMFFYDAYGLYKILRGIEKCPEGLYSDLKPEEAEKYYKEIDEVKKEVFDNYFKNE